jgi:hypothetical protein
VGVGRAAPAAGDGGGVGRAARPPAAAGGGRVGRVVSAGEGGVGEIDFQLLSLSCGACARDDGLSQLRSQEFGIKETARIVS